MQTLTINHRTYEYNQDIQTTLEFNPQKKYFCQLNYLNVIEAEGAQASTFLQGQLTNDIHQLKPSQIQRNLLCNLKGQIISQIFVGMHDHQYYLICPKDLNKEVLGILNKIALLSKVNLNPYSDKKVFGMFENDHLTLSTEPPSTEYIEKPNLFWHYQCLLHQQFEIYPATCRLFLPHHLEMEQSGWINFKKGCYRGQEIIARMHYLGKSKYQLKTQLIDTSATLCPGNWVVDDNHQKIGELVDFCPINAHQSIIMVCIKKENINDQFDIINKQID